MWRRWLLTKTGGVKVTTLPVQDFADIPTATRLPIFGTSLSLIAAGAAPKLHEYIDKRHRELGPIFRECIGPVDAVFVSRPADMRAVFNREGKYPRHVLPDAWILYNEMFGCKRGLFFMDGEEWLHFRRIMNKLLLKSDSLLWLQEPCEHAATSFARTWLDLLNDNNKSDAAIVCNLEQQLYRVSIDTIIAILLGDNYPAFNAHLTDDLEHLASIVHLIFLASAKLQLIPAKLAQRFKLRAWREFVDAVDDALCIAFKITKRIIAECPEGNGLITKMIKEKLNEADMSRIIADLILAAGDTTAHSTQWILYLLAKNPEIQDKISELSKNKENTMDYSNYLKSIIREGLRLYPIAPFLTRIMPQDTSIGGYFIPNGTLTILSLYTSTRNPDNFPQPEKFWPERWLRNGVREFTAACPNASLPFAIGSRSCIGRKIAETQMMSILKQITDSFNLSLANDKPVNMILRMVSVPDSPILLKINKK